ncbi:DoxX family protein [Granulicella arctica]|uniref:Putative oxidoreductase n=1 Tax=Granulicella arctica TaxID=940613 RepID=A0A7Y9TIA9_9BACT|nr:DoxX family protein [Granulicella arctica]NYF80800.1 putative oxidoreductase [Granulicella arctica]
MNTLAKRYTQFSAATSALQSPFLLAIRLYWGWQFAVSGWGKMQNIPKFTTFFNSINIPFPAFNAHFVAGVEFFGGLLLIVGLASRFAGLILAGNMLVAYWTADHEALLSVFSDSDKFTSAAEITFLMAALTILVFGAGRFSLDALFKGRLKERAT